MKKLKQETGNTLIEGIVALALLCTAIVAILSLVAVLVFGRMTSKSFLNQAVVLTGMQNEAAMAVKAEPDKSSLTVCESITEVVAHYPGWRCEILETEKGLYHVTYIFSDQWREYRYEGQVFSGKP